MLIDLLESSKAIGLCPMGKVTERSPGDWRIFHTGLGNQTDKII